MYQLHIANKNYSTWSLRPWILMRELGIAFEERMHQFPQDGTAAIFRPFSPSGRVPSLHDGELVIWDSMAIAEYLAERHSGVWPSEGAARAWARSAAAEMHSGFEPLRTACSMSCGVRIKLPAISPELAKDLARISELWGEGLRRFGGPFLAGATFTNVDAFFAPVAFRIQTYGLVLEAPAAAYAAHLLALPGMQQWYAAALAEPWRELGHDEHIAKAGELTADLRAPVSP